MDLEKTATLGCSKKGSSHLRLVINLLSWHERAEGRLCHARGRLAFTRSPKGLKGGGQSPRLKSTISRLLSSPSTRVIEELKIREKHGRALEHEIRRRHVENIKGGPPPRAAQVLPDPGGGGSGSCETISGRKKSKENPDLGVPGCGSSIQIGRT